MTSLLRYDAACAALAEAVTANEVLMVRATAEGFRTVARMAKNLDLEIKAVRLRTDAETRLGQMLTEAEGNGTITSHGGNNKKQDSETETCSRATLREIGIGPKLSSQARKLSGIGAQAVQAMLDRMERESRQQGRIAVNVITNELGRRTADTRRSLAQELSDKCAELSLTGRKFPVLYADPAWKRKAGIGNRAYENNYTTMGWADILDMPVAQRLLPDAWGFLWIPRAHLLAAIEIEMDTSLGPAMVKVPLAWAIMLKWGFTSYSTCAVWTKTDEEFPEDQGTGLIFYDQDELLLVFKRGRGLPKPDTDKKHGSNHRERSRRHSAKPQYYRQMINDMTGGVPVLELFAREDGEHELPENFFTWGNQSRNSAEKDYVPHDAETGEVVEGTR